MNKSTVCRIANRIPRTTSRRDAFIKAWEIVKTGSLKLAVKGVTFGNRQTALKRLAKYPCDKVVTFLVPEPKNNFDKNAIAVKVGVQYGRGLYTLGYVSKEMTGLVKALKPKTITTQIISGDIYGVRLSLAA
ncbi:MAG: HIRAN domain-containing protein [Spirochaetaceae bacterium]|nr:HIRAN domain-containing protein [Spirochaetaceae bacterium]